jgi:hypothetical protein
MKGPIRIPIFESTWDRLVHRNVAYHKDADEGRKEKTDVVRFTGALSGKVAVFETTE